MQIVTSESQIREFLMAVTDYELVMTTGDRSVRTALPDYRLSTKLVKQMVIRGCNEEANENE